MHGFSLIHRRFGAGGTQLREKSKYLAAAVDILCVNSSGGDLVGSAAGSDVVRLDLANFVDQSLPRVAKSAAASNGPILGVVHWGEGTVGDGKQLWVRIVGRHPYAKVDGTTDVAAGDLLATHSGTAGALERTSTLANGVAMALEARTDNTIGPTKVLLLNRMGIPTS